MSVDWRPMPFPEEILDRAIDISRLLEPPRWRFLKHRYWREHQRPDQVARALSAALRGEYEPLRNVGWLRT